MLIKKITFPLLLTIAFPLLSPANVHSLPDATDATTLETTTTEVRSETATPASKLDPVTPATGIEAEPETPETPVVVSRKLVLSLKQRRVYVYEDDKAIANYRVAIGKKGWETPKGDFKVLQKVENPVWKNPWNGKISQPGPKSPLGLRWIGFWTDGKNAIGFHGTPGEHLLGQAVSHGCVRMRNADIIAMFELVDIDTPVIVR